MSDKYLRALEYVEELIDIMITMKNRSKDINDLVTMMMKYMDKDTIQSIIDKLHRVSNDVINFDDKTDILIIIKELIDILKDILEGINDPECIDKFIIREREKRLSNDVERELHIDLPSVPLIDPGSKMEKIQKMKKIQ